MNEYSRNFAKNFKNYAKTFGITTAKTSAENINKIFQEQGFWDCGHGKIFYDGILERFYYIKNKRG
jgi:uncharacterized membrane protein